MCILEFIFLVKLMKKPRSISIIITEDPLCLEALNKSGPRVLLVTLLDSSLFHSLFSSQYKTVQTNNFT